MAVSKGNKCLMCKTDHPPVTKIKCCPGNFLEEFLKPIYIKMSISDFNESMQLNKMLDSQTIVTCYALGRILLF